MWSININDRDGVIYVRASRWQTGSAYPTQLLEFQMIPRPGESELGMLQRIGRGIYAEAADRASHR